MFKHAYHHTEDANITLIVAVCCTQKWYVELYIHQPCFDSS